MERRVVIESLEVSRVILAVDVDQDARMQVGGILIAPGREGGKWSRINRICPLSCVNSP